MRMKSFRERNKYAVGLVSMAVLAAMVVVTFLIGQRGLLEGGYWMSGVFDDTGGIKVGDRVKVAGVPVGSVKEVAPDYTRGKVIVKWTVADDVQLGRKSRAEIMTSNVLGGRYLRVTGPVSPPYMADLPEARRVIPNDRTQTPFMINEALKKGTALAKRFDTKTLKKLIGQIEKINKDKTGRVSRTLKELNEVGEIFTENEQDLQEVMANSKKATATIAKKDRQLGRLLDSASVVLDQLRKRRKELRAQLGAGNELVTSLSNLIDKHQKELTKMIDDLNETVGVLEPRRKDLNTALAHVGPTIGNLSSIGGNGPWIEVIVAGLGPLSPDLLASVAEGSRQARQGSGNDNDFVLPGSPGDEPRGDEKGRDTERPVDPGDSGDDDEWSLLPGLPPAPGEKG